jgi:hypothetical protein
MTQSDFLTMRLMAATIVLDVCQIKGFALPSRELMDSSVDMVLREHRTRAEEIIKANASPNGGAH